MARRANDPQPRDCVVGIFTQTSVPSLNALMSIAIRWARAEDAPLPFIADAIPTAVVASRIESRHVAVADVDGVPTGTLQLDFLWGTRPYVAMIRVTPAYDGGVLRGINEGGIDEVFFRKSLSILRAKLDAEVREPA